jgi:hypothetical protein
MSEITVVTSLIGGRDNLRDDQTDETSKFIAFTDQIKSDKWQIKPPYRLFNSIRRNSRVPKILIHQFVDTEYSIWLDANIALRVPAQELVDKHLKDHDFAVFRHPERDCIYDEAMIAAVHRLDDPEVIIEQVKGYEDRGFAKHKGLAECNVVIRRHTPKVEQFNNAWWSEYCRHSVRDQISFMYVADKVGLRVNFIEQAARWGNPDFSFVNHLKDNRQEL